MGIFIDIDNFKRLTYMYYNYNFIDHQRVFVYKICNKNSTSITSLTHLPPKQIFKIKDCDEYLVLIIKNYLHAWFQRETHAVNQIFDTDRWKDSLQNYISQILFHNG